MGSIRFAARSSAADAYRKRTSYKPPRGETNDDEFAHLLSGNILYDPGIELFVGNAVGSYEIHDWNERTGEDHYTLPNYDPACSVTSQRWPNGDCVDYYDIAQWVSLGTPYTVTGDLTDSAWHVTRLEPFLGLYTMAWWQWTRGPGGNPHSLLIQGPGMPGGYSARVVAGDRVTWSVQAQMWDYDQGFWGSGWNGGATISPLLTYYTESGATIVGGGNFYQNLSFSYASYEYDTTAPIGSYFVRAMVAFLATSPSVYRLARDPLLLVDSGVLSIE